MPKHEVPQALIDYVAKTGFITKELWRKYFFAGGSDRWFYQSWTNLHENQYLKPHPEPALKDVSVLNLKNPGMKNLLDGKPVKHVYAGYINHDSHLYDGLLELEKQKAIEHWETEAQLKSRMGEYFYSNGFTGETVKFPDALAYISEIKWPWAVEMEMSVKNKRRYERTLDAYNMRKDISGVLFIFRDKAVMEGLQRAHQATYYNGPKIIFMELEKWKRDPVSFVTYVKNELCTPTSPTAS